MKLPRTTLPAAPSLIPCARSPVMKPCPDARRHVAVDDVTARARPPPIELCLAV